MNPSPPLDTEFLSDFVRKCHWMRKSRDWKERLLWRLAEAHLDLLTQQSLTPGEKEPGFVARLEKRRT
jgi:hypothetical protein